MKPADREFFYSLLGRLESDCKCFLTISSNENQLYAKSVLEQIKTMKEIYGLFLDSERPAWIDLATIEKYGKQMTEKLEQLKYEYTWTAVVKSRNRVSIPEECWKVAGFDEKGSANGLYLKFPFDDSPHWRIHCWWKGVTYNHKNNGREGNIFRLVVPFRKGITVRLIPDPKTHSITIKPIDYVG